MSLQLHQPDGRGGLVPREVSERDWRRQLRARRWGLALRGRRLPEMRNVEAPPTPTAIAVLFWVGLAALTFVLIVVGYGTGFWG
ncbi:MAG TPA: hypothetical protein VNJ28_02695 [Candidatus Limnocylindrales bacterium]|nr:hypothetical protein [Candidatus Limnocylindrales bacterium]